VVGITEGRDDEGDNRGVRRVRIITGSQATTIGACQSLGNFKVVALV